MTLSEYDLIFCERAKILFKNHLTTANTCGIIAKRDLKESYGELAQLARASGSYPAGRWFKSDIRYQMSKPTSASTFFYGALVKRLRHGPFTAVTGVRFP